MLRIRYSDRALDIEGSDQDYVALRAKIDKLLNGQYISAIEILCDKNSDPAPDDKSCKKLRIILGSGRNEFSLDGSTLTVKGSAIALKNFSDNFPDGGKVNSKGIRYHHHYDVISLPEYISRDSPDVVLSLRA